MLKIGFKYAGGIFSHSFILLNSIKQRNISEKIYVDSRLGGALSPLHFNFL